MKKSFFSLQLIFSLMIGMPLNAMMRGQGLVGVLLRAHANRLTPLQSQYLAKGKKEFLVDLSRGVVPPNDVKSIAQVFTRKSFIQPENCIQIFSERVSSMDEIRKAAEEKYPTIVNVLTEELVQDSLDCAKVAIDIDPSLVREIVDKVPSILERPALYWHGFTTREGTLLDYVEDEIAETLDSEQLTRLTTVKENLLARGAKRLRELYAEAAS